MKARVAVILASTETGPHRMESLNAFVREAHGLGEVVVVDASTLRIEVSVADLRTIARPPGSLVPELWRAGLREVDAELVVFSTTQMVPSVGWLQALVTSIDRSDATGAGGLIVAGEGLGCVDRAIYLQRYLSYSSAPAMPVRPSGENAIYRRSVLIEQASSWAEGFWETEVQSRIEGQGGSWAKAPGAIVTYRGTTRLASITRQRVAHARRFGAVRAEGCCWWSRWARSIATPVVPAVLLARVFRGLICRGISIKPWTLAVPSFLAVAGAWACGETLGRLFGPGVK